jgi:hypothetical protein
MESITAQGIMAEMGVALLAMAVAMLAMAVALLATAAFEWQSFVTSPLPAIVNFLNYLPLQ